MKNAYRKLGPNEEVRIDDKIDGISVSVEVVGRKASEFECVMRKKITYLSPSSLQIYNQDKIKFYLQYLADYRLHREGQTEPMAVGSSFDAYVKSYLHEKLFGAGSDPRFDFTTIFEAQVSNNRRDAALVAGKYIFDLYKQSGALTDLMVELNASVTTPRFEFDLMGIVNHSIDGIPFLGKPDLFYTNKMGARVVHDFKVNGYYSKSGASPIAGYVRLREIGRNYQVHKNALVMNWKGILINTAQTLDMVKQDWAAQLAIYMWLLGENVGTQECVASVDQIVCRPYGIFPAIRFAEHRARISKEFQFSLFTQAHKAWNCITSGHFFDDMTFEDSEKRCLALDTFHKDVMERPSTTTNEEWHNKITRPY